MTIEQWLTDRAPIWSRSDLSVALGALEAVTAIARLHARVATALGVEP